MGLVYAPRGLLGVLTPQANTTVEPELQLLCPPGLSLLTSRMCSPAGDLRSRLIDYYKDLRLWTQAFANAPLGALASACTGASYLIGAQAEDQMFSELAARNGYPATNSALAAVAALQALQARRIALVSPYPDWLTEHSRAYWLSRGLRVQEVVQLASDADAFHPIYALQAQAAERGIAAIDRADIDAVLLLGTGTPTLPVLARRVRTRRGQPIVSCNLALLWHALECMHGHAQSPRASALLGLMQDRRWRRALSRLLGGG